jgi:arabinan endo-1,5-alpha-L-arabinosidase
MRFLHIRLKALPVAALVASLGCAPGGADGGMAGRAAAGQGGAATAGVNGGTGAAGNGAAGAGGTSGSAGGSTTGAAGDGGGGGGTGATAGTGGAAAGGGGTAGGPAGAGGGGAGTSGGGSGGGAAGRGGAAGGRGGAGGASGAAGGRGGTTGTAGGPGGAPACPGTVWDGSSAVPQPLALSGSLGAHDPAALVVNNTIYLFATGLIAKTSTNLTSWQSGSNPLNPRPAWVAQNVPGATNLWAPDIVYFGGMYHLYYSASTFGSNESCIGHATKTDIASGSWMDRGTVICSNMGSTNDNWNAIDPNVVIDDAGTPWMDFGSFWGGIKMIKLDAATGGRATDDTMVYSIADRPQGRGGPEGPWIIKRCGYYYLFESWGACCDGAFDYNMRVGRSTTVNRDYVDKAGMRLLGGGGGTLVSTGNATVHAPGHNAVIVYNDKTYSMYHALNASNQNAQLRIVELVWDADGWPVQHAP